MLNIFRELRSSLENPQTPLSFPAEWLLDLFNGGRTDSGIRVSELTALQVSTVYACVDLISGALAAAPFNVYELLQPRGKRIAHDQNIHWLLHDEPNPEMTGFSFRKALQCHMLLWGNGFAEIERDSAGRPVALWPMDPSQTRPRRATQQMAWRNSGGIQRVLQPGDLFYVTRKPIGQNEEKFSSDYLIAKEDILHLPGLTLDGRMGRSLVELCRQAIGLALATEKFGGKFFANGLRPSLVVSVPQDMTPAQKENFKRSIRESNGGENQHLPLVLEEGMKVDKASFTPDEAQFIGTREYQRNELAALFHVPPHMVGDTKNTNRSTAEQIGIEFVQYTLKPWVAPWQQETSRKLFPNLGRSAGKYVTGIDLQDLVMPDSESRGKFISLMRQWGVWSANDTRDFTGQNPILEPWADKCWRPVNMVEADAPPPPAPEPGRPPKDEPPPEDGGEGEANRYAAAYRPMFVDAFRRISAREKVDSDAIYKAFAPVLGSIAAGIEMNSAPLLGVAAAEESEEVREFIREYCGGLHKQWDKRKADAEVELLRAVRAVRVAVFRELATRKAKSSEVKTQ